jgi:hypothetical protein
MYCPNCNKEYNHPGFRCSCGEELEPTEEELLRERWYKENEKKGT